jgi:NAD(P)-dependent dehydrogenase (short-subunit alcohol dehydrogenase family)
MNGKVGVVTGAAAGLGAAIAADLASAGAHVVGLDASAELDPQAHEAAEAGQGSIELIQGDVREEADVAQVVAAAVRRGQLDFFVNNAGVALEKRLHETSVEEWDRLSAVNLRGSFLGCKHAVLAMRGNGGGSIVNVGSIVSFLGDNLLPAYATTKAGLLGLTRVVALDYADEGIRCNAICPGDMETPMILRTFEATGDAAVARAEMESAYPVKRIGQPSEVAKAVTFLLSDDASFITGASLLVDGGLSIKPY